MALLFLDISTGPVAQWITRLTTDQEIPGSNPGRFDSFSRRIPCSNPASMSGLHACNVKRARNVSEQGKKTHLHHKIAYFELTPGGFEPSISDSVMRGAIEIRATL